MKIAIVSILIALGLGLINEFKILGPDDLMGIVLIFIAVLIGKNT